MLGIIKLKFWYVSFFSFFFFQREKELGKRLVLACFRLGIQCFISISYCALIYLVVYYSLGYSLSISHFLLLSSELPLTKDSMMCEPTAGQNEAGA